MFPTFISILDIQSWWEVPSIAYFCSLFRTSFNLLDFDIEDLEEALLQDGTEDPSWLQELIVRLLCGCLDNNNDISTFNYQMYLRRLFRQKCHESQQPNPFNTDIDFQFLPLRTKVQILHALCDYRLDAQDVLDRLRNLEADSLRVEPLGTDQNDSRYWYFYGTRLYREDNPVGSQTGPGKKAKTIWQVICFTEDDWHNLAKKFKNSEAKSERRLYKVLKENFLPDLPRLFHEKEVLHRKRLLEWLPMRRGATLRRASPQSSPNKSTPPKANTPPSKKLNTNKKHKNQNQSFSENEKSDNDEENSEKNQKSASPAPKKRKSRELRALTDGQNQNNESIIKPISCGRQTNNSLASATGDRILIKQSTPPPHQNNSVNSKSTSKKEKNQSSEKTEKNVEKSKEKPEKSAKEEVVEVKKRGRKKKVDTTNTNTNASKENISNTKNVEKKVPEPILAEVNTSADLDDLRIGMYKVLESVKAHEDAWPFIEPVEEEYAPNYYTVVRKPMDLQTMEDRLDAGAYTTSERFRNDFKLIVDNCRLYNGAENEYTEMVDNLSVAFKIAVKKYLDQSESNSDDESDEEDETVVIKNGPVKNRSNTPPKVKHKKHKKQKTIVRKRTPTPPRSPTPPPKTPPPPQPQPIKRGRGRPAKNKPPVETPQPKTEPKKIKTIPKKEKKRSLSRSPTPEKILPKKEPFKNNKRKLVEEDSPSKKLKQDFDKIDSKSKEWDSEDDIYIQNKKNWESKDKNSKKDKNRSDKIKNEKRDNWDDDEIWDEKNWDTKNWDRETKETISTPKKIKNEKKDNWDEDFSDDDNFTKKDSNLKNIELKTEIKKDKNVKLRETIEKLKEMNNLSEDVLKKSKKEPPLKKEVNKLKPLIKTQQQQQKKPKKCEFDFDSEDSCSEKNISKVKPVVKSTKVTDIDALEAATEQTLKDINKWLDDTPKFSEFSSASNSPLHLDEEPHSIGGVPKPPKGFKSTRGGKRRLPSLKEGNNTPPTVTTVKRPQQRTIDRLQPGKSKGNLLSQTKEVPTTEETEPPLFPLGRIREPKGVALKNVDESPKLSLGTVLDSFGKHKFENENDKKPESPSVGEEGATPTEAPVEEEVKEKVVKDEEKEEAPPEAPKEEKEKEKPKSATPNLSAWFKAFGAPKVTPPVTVTKKKTDEETEKEVEVKASPPEEARTRRAPSLEPDSPFGTGAPIRQRRGSTGSSVSERSSFSQDLDMSPRDERTGIGSYPAPYPSPLHRSPAASASPSPRHDPHTYPAALNGSIRVGFYQDTVATKSSPCSNSPVRPLEEINQYSIPSYYQKPSVSSPPPPTPSIRPPTPDDIPEAPEIREKSPEPPVAFPVKKRAYNDDMLTNMGASPQNLSPRNSDDEDRHDYSSKDVRIPSLPRRYDDSPPPPTPNPIIEKPAPVTTDFNRPIYGNPYNQKVENMGYEPPRVEKPFEIPRPETLRNDNVKINMGYESESSRINVPENPKEIPKVPKEKLDLTYSEPLKVNMGYEPPKLNYDNLVRQEKLYDALPQRESLSVPRIAHQGDTRPFDSSINTQRAHQGEIRTHPNEVRAHPGEIRAHQGEVRAHQGDIRAHQGERAHQSEIRAHQGDIRAHQGEIRAHQGDIRTSESSINPIRAHQGETTALTKDKNLYEGLRVPSVSEKIDMNKLNMGYMSGVNSIDLTAGYGSPSGVKAPSVTTGIDTVQPHRSASQYLASQYADTRLNHPVAAYLAMQNQPPVYNKQPGNFKPSTTENSTFKQTYAQSNTTSPLGHNFDRFSAELHGLAAASYYADKSHLYNKMHMYNQTMAAAYRQQQQLIGQPDLQQYQGMNQNAQLNQGRGASPQVAQVTNVQSTGIDGQKGMVSSSSVKKSKRVAQAVQQQQTVQGFQSYADLKASSTQPSAQEMGQSTSTPQIKGSAFNLPWSEQGPLLDAALWAQRSATGGPTTPGSTSSAYTSLAAPPPPYLGSVQPSATPGIDQPLYQQYLQSMQGLLASGGAGPGAHPGAPPYPHPHPHHQYHPALASQLGRQQPFHNMNRPWM